MCGTNFDSESNFFGRLSGKDCINLITSLNGIRHDRKYCNAVADYSEFFELRTELTECVQTYSSGMREKLGYIISLLLPTRLLVYDDFGKNLDEEIFLRFVDHLRNSVKQGKYRGIVISSPKKDFLNSLSDVCYRIERKRIKAL